MTKILTIDSSTEACSVALDIVGTVSSLFELAPRRHAELLLPMVDRLLSEANVELGELDAIGCCVGPGAFTGLRIAISVAQGLAYASNLPCIAISSLDVLAEQAFATSTANYCLSSIDARMKEVYFSVLKRGGDNNPERVLSEQVISPDLIELSSEIDSTKSIIKVGTGWSEYEYPNEIKALNGLNAGITQQPIKYPNAKWVIPIANRKLAKGETVTPELLQPVYLRNNVAVKKSDRK